MRDFLAFIGGCTLTAWVILILCLRAEWRRHTREDREQQGAEALWLTEVVSDHEPSSTTKVEVRS